MSNDDLTILSLIANGDARTTGEWIICAVEGCEDSADIDMLNVTDDGQRVFVPLCRPHLFAVGEGERIAWIVTMHGFVGGDPERR